MDFRKDGIESKGRIKFVDDQYSNGTTAYGVKSIFVKREMSFHDLESTGLFGEFGGNIYEQ